MSAVSHEVPDDGGIGDMLVDRTTKEILAREWGCSPDDVRGGYLAPLGWLGDPDDTVGPMLRQAHRRFSERAADAHGKIVNGSAGDPPIA